jgi:hypothetical protein
VNHKLMKQIDQFERLLLDFGFSLSLGHEPDDVAATEYIRGSEGTNVVEIDGEQRQVTESIVFGAGVGTPGNFVEFCFDASGNFLAHGVWG